jgi:hypothetical protein
VGSLANAVIAAMLRRSQKLPTNAFKCVTQAEFDATGLRPSALKINMLDAKSGGQTIRGMCG